MSHSVDTLSIYQRLKSANLKDEAAQEIADVFRDVIESNLATNTDFEIVKNDLEKTIANTKSEIIKMGCRYAGCSGCYNSNSR